MLADFRQALRSWLKSPSFAIVAVLTLALGLGAATAIFSVVNAVLLRPLPYPHQERLVDLRELDEKGHAMPFAEPNVSDLRARSKSFESLAYYASEPQAVFGGNEPARVNVCAASPDFFRVLELRPFIGRTFSDSPSDTGVVVSFGFWKRVLGGRADLNGLALSLSNRTFPVIGVLPAESSFPTDAEVWCPSDIYPPNSSRTAHNWQVIARLLPGVPFAQANAEIAGIGRQLKAEHDSDTDAATFGATPLRERIVRNIRELLIVLACAVGLLLAIAVSNVANLVLVRTNVRHKEVALRVALGASRGRLFRQFLAESLLLSLAGGTLGALLASWAVKLIVRLYQDDLPRFASIQIDSTVFLFSLGLWALLGLLLACVPAWSRAARDLRSGLQQAGRGQSSSMSSRRTRNFLVIAQVALTLMLLVGAGLLGRSFQKLLSINPGFVPESTVVMTVSMPDPADASESRKLAQFYERLLGRLERIPGEISAGGVEAIPLFGGTANGTFLIEQGGKSAETMEELSKQFAGAIANGRAGDAIFHIASAGYFRTMAIPLLHGRNFQESDGAESPHVALISESLARRYFHDHEPVGQQIQFGNMDGDLHLLTIVGIVADVRDRALDSEPQPTVYVHYLQRAARASEFSFVVKGQGDGRTLIAAMRREATATNPQMPLKFQTLNQIVAASLENRRFGMVMVAGFAAAALALAMVGLYGIMAFITAERTTEVGIRMALGAQKGDVLYMILRQGFSMVAAGVLIGIAAALAATRLLGTMLYQVETTDVLTYAVVIALLGAAALLASYFPARRAMGVDPVEALRRD
jgi:putative ABC transport system permease protein